MRSKAVCPKCKSWNELEGKLKEQGHRHPLQSIAEIPTANKGVLFSEKTVSEFSGSTIDRAFSFTKLDLHFTHVQQQAQHRATLFGNLSAAAGSTVRHLQVCSAVWAVEVRAKSRHRSTGKAGGIPLPPASSPVGVSAEQLQRKPGESPERAYRTNYGAAQCRGRSDGHRRDGTPTQTRRTEREEPK